MRLEALDQTEVRPLEFDWALNLTRQETLLANVYWRSRHIGDRFPSRADMSPLGMKGFMPNVGFVEIRQEPDRRDYFIRLAGTKWEEVFGPITGRLLQEFLPKHVESRWRLLFDAVCERKQPVRATTQITFKNMSWLTTEMFVAPLTGGTTTDIAMLFMCFTSWSTSR